jgi:hypothetical protein
MPRLFGRFTFVLMFLAAHAFAQSTPSAAADARPASGSAATPVNTAGTIDFTDGDVRVFDSTRTRRPALKMGDTLNEGDSVVTGTDGELHLNMRDGGYLAIRPGTAMRITKYQANGDDNDISVFGLLKGTLRSITGFIGKYNPRAYKIYTPTATIGVRGTDHETYVIQPGDTTGDAGTYDKVNNGGTFIQTPQGRTEVSPNQAGFAGRGGAKPRVLDKVPGFFKPTKNEHLIEKRVAERPQLQQLREQRKQQVQERKGQKAAQKAGDKEGGAKEARAGQKASAAGKAATPFAAKQSAREQAVAERQKNQADRKQQLQQKLDGLKKAREEKAGERKAAREKPGERKRKKED